MRANPEEALVRRKPHKVHRGSALMELLIVVIVLANLFGFLGLALFIAVHVW